MTEIDVLAERATERGLDVTASLLTRFPSPALFEHQLPADARVTLPPHAEAEAILGQLVRRGLDPVLVKALLDRWADRPLERALVARDALQGALLVPGDPLREELHAAVAPLAPVLPPPGRPGLDLNQHPARELLARFSGADSLRQAHQYELFEQAFTHRLAALTELHRRGDPLPARPGAVDSLRRFALLLHLAHLPTLSSVILDYLSRDLEVRASALDLCEVLFDARAAERIPGDAIRNGDLPPAQLADASEYLMARGWLALDEPRKAYALLQESQRTRDVRRPAPSARLLGLRAHLGALAGDRSVSLQTIDRICQADPMWRYGARARVVVAAAQSPLDSARPFELLHEYLSAFGPDYHTWSEALTVAPPTAGWRKETVRLLTRELAALPHELGLWRLLLQIVGEPADIQRGVDELAQRLRA